MTRKLDLPNPFGGAVFHLPTTDTTMLEAQRLVGMGSGDGTLVMADHQQQGRGRFPERSWTAEPGDSLLFTLVTSKITSFPPSLVWAVALARYLEHYALKPVTIKWPNDVLIDGQKVAGILVTQWQGWFFHGMGVNLRQKAFPDDYRRPATSLSLHGWEMDTQELLQDLLPFLFQTFSGRDDFQNEVQSRLHGLGRQVRLSVGLGQEVLDGFLVGVGDKGQALLKVQDQIQEVYSGE